MKKWYLKAFIQKIFSFIPFGIEMNYFFQKLITKAVVLNDDFFEDLINHGDILINEYVILHGSDFSQLKCLELGSGWYPIIPFYLYLIGAETIHSADLNDHIKKGNVIDLVLKFNQYFQEGKLNQYVLESRLDSLNSANKNLIITEDLNFFFNSINIKFFIGDFSSIHFSDFKYDLCFSVNVLEHISEQLLNKILLRFYELGKEKVFYYHSFGSYDHFYHIDKSISKFNFLKYSKTQWKWIDNKIQMQNRIRVPQFKKLFIDLNYIIIKEIHSEPNIEEMLKIKLHSDFKYLKEEENAIDYGTFILGK